LKPVPFVETSTEFAPLTEVLHGLGKSWGQGPDRPLLSVFAIGVTAKLALAQETKCYLMVCTGSVCVANQIPCPKTDPTKPAPDPGAG
jgi:hypothetical protein